MGSFSSTLSMRPPMDKRLKRALIEFFAELEQISGNHDELTDTDVREALHLTLNYYFVWGKPRSRFST